MEAGRYYHVYNRGINKETIYKEPKNFHYFLEQYGKYLNNQIETLSYCLMPTHFHLFIRLKDDSDPDTVTKSFKNFFISYAKSINKNYNRTGSLFQAKFKKKQIESDDYFSAIVAYLHLNPTRSGLVNHPSEWMFSSYNAFVSDQPTNLMRANVLDWFGGRIPFIEFHESFIDIEFARKLIYS
jgi:putative transposase